MIKAIYLEPDIGRFRALRCELRGLLSETRGMALVDHARAERDLWLALAREQYDVVLVGYALAEPDDGVRDSVVIRLLSRDTSPALVILNAPELMAMDHARLAWVEQHRLLYLAGEDMAPDRLHEALQLVLARRMNILVIDDDPEDYELIRVQLALDGSRHYVTTWAETIEQAKELVAARPDEYDAYIVDYRFPSGNGVELIRDLLAMGVDKPMLLVTSGNRIEIESEAVRLVGRGQMKFLNKKHLGASQISSALLH